MNKTKVEKILNRKIYENLCNLDLQINPGERILITGAKGSIGTRLVERLKKYKDVDYLETDIVGDVTYLDITDFQNTFSVVNKFKPTAIINIAGAKHAPLGEREIWKTLSINTIGTMNLVDAAPAGCRIILTSTCKANNPEVVYGASKLIAEKMALASGGSVARFFNVVETAGNVFEIWDKVPADQPIKVANNCRRHFISVEESVGLIIFALTAKPGRYAVNSPEKLSMEEIAERLYPNRKKEKMKPRTGDRLIEIFKSTSEECNLIFNESILNVVSVHDN